MLARCSFFCRYAARSATRGFDGNGVWWSTLSRGILGQALDSFGSCLERWYLNDVFRWRCVVNDL